MHYGAIAVEQVRRRGGGLPFLSIVEQILIGESESWDQIAIMEYPDRKAFIDMIHDPEYRAALVHRNAGLKRTVLIITRPAFAPK